MSLSIAPFIPKAATPFQWLPMARPEVLEPRLRLIRKRLSREGIEVKAESVGWSVVQAVLARGDSRLADVLADLPEDSLAAWRGTARKHGLDLEEQACRELPQEDLPWSALDTGIDPCRLRQELERALDAQ